MIPILVGVDGRAAERLVDRRHDLDVVLEESGALVQCLFLVVERVHQPRVLVACGEEGDTKLER